MGQGFALFGGHFIFLNGGCKVPKPLIKPLLTGIIQRGLSKVRVGIYTTIHGVVVGFLF